jgi:hypothetical protein
VRLANDDALAGRQAIRLDHQRQPLRAHVAFVEIRRRESGEARCWDAVPREEIFGESLRTFQARGRLRWAEASLAGGAKTIGDAGDQWTFRAYDGQIDVFLEGEFKQAVEVVGCDVDVADFGFCGRARVAGRDEHVIDARG